MRSLLLCVFVALFSVLLIYRNTISDTIQSILHTPHHSPPMDTTKSFEGIPAVPPQDPSLNKTDSMTVPRAIKQAFLAVEQAEGAGARVRRSIGTPRLRNFSPFLMLDHFSIAPTAGFPDHPHRGQETITYLLSGAVDHEDFAGNKGTIWPGDLQFMTAGKGIMHAEMPHHEPPDPKTGVSPPIVGMQLWVDLPQKLKKCDPRYRDLRAAEIPKATLDDGKVEVKVISGQSHGVDSVQELAYTPVWLLDVTMKPGAHLTQSLPKTWNAFTYTLQGDTKFGAGKDTTTIGQYYNVVFQQEGDSIVAEVDADAKEDSRFSEYSPNLMIFDHRLMLDSHRRGYASGPESRPVRSIRTQHTGRSLSSGFGLPDQHKRIRKSFELGKRDWKDDGSLAGKPDDGSRMYDEMIRRSIENVHL